MPNEKPSAEITSEYKKRVSLGFLFYLFIIGSYPLVFLYTANQHKISSLSELAPWLLTVCCALAFIFLVSWPLLKDRTKSALLAAFIGFWWMSLQLYALPLTRLLAGIDLSCPLRNLNLVVKIFWLTGFFTGTISIIRLKRVPPLLDSFLTNTSIILCISALFSIGTCEFNRTRTSKQTLSGPVKHTINSNKESPNIYFIILDAYARADNLKTNFGFDNEDFLSCLKKKGFEIEDSSWSNYCQTILSLSTTLNLNYLNEILAHNKQGNALSPSDEDTAVAFKLIANSEASRFLRERGYRFVAVSAYIPEFEGTERYKNITSICTPFDNDAFEMLLLHHILDFFKIPELDPQRALRRKNLLDCIDIITKSDDKEAPLFVIGHIVAPHPPFVFKSDGSPAQGVMCTWDGSEYFKRAQDKELYKSQYIDQLKWVNHRVLEIIDTIEKKASRPSIIVLEGDHGSALNYDCYLLEKTNLCERFANLLAIKLPPSMQKDEPLPFHTPINIFRFIFSHCFNADYPLLAERSYYSSAKEPFKCIDISSALMRCAQGSSNEKK